MPNNFVVLTYSSCVIFVLLIIKYDSIMSQYAQKVNCAI